MREQPEAAVDAQHLAVHVRAGRAHSAASVRIIPTIPAFAAVYATWPGRPVSAGAGETCTIAGREPSLGHLAPVGQGPRPHLSAQPGGAKNGAEM